MKHVLIQERKSLFLFLRYLLLLFVMPTELIAQSITISGTVTDSNKEAVIGANVLLKGTSTGTITDVEGKYQLTVPENGTLFYVVKNDNVITFNRRLDAILINVLNGKIYQIMLLKDSNIFIANGTSIPSGFYKVTMIISI